MTPTITTSPESGKDNSGRKHTMANRMLWCVHVYGPDSLVAQPDFETAVARAKEQQDYIDSWYNDREVTEHDPIVFCWAEPWPWSEDRHAADLAEHGGNPEDWT